MIEIRNFTPADRDTVRSIAFATGYMGEPIDWLWPDRESFADLFTRYYTEHEPDSILIAERDRIVVGYLFGCTDTHRALGSMQREALRQVGRGVLFRPGAAGFFWRCLFDVIRDRGAAREEILDPRWPAHLHINLLPAGRGAGLGRGLVTTWFDRLRQASVPGIHLGTFAENHNAQRFFTSCGFAHYGEPERVPGFRTRSGERMHTQWMVRDLV